VAQRFGDGHVLDADVLRPLELQPDAAAIEYDGQWFTWGQAADLAHRVGSLDVRDRQVIMSLDGKRLTQLFFGQTFTCDIEPGPHRLRANNTLVWKTVEFIAPAGTHVHFTCINRAPAGMMYMLALFGVAPLFVTLRPGHPTFVHGS